MYRAAFLSVGLYMVLCGVGFLFVDDVKLKEQASTAAPRIFRAVSRVDPEGRRHVTPPEWFPYTCIGVGTVTMLYAVALPRE